MNKRGTYLSIIAEATLALKLHINNAAFQRIMWEHDIAVYDPHGGLYALDRWNTPAMYSYEQVVRKVAKENNLTHVTDPILNKLETLTAKDNHKRKS